LERQSFIFDYLKILEEDKDISQNTLDEMLAFLEDKLCTKAPASLKIEDPEKLKKYLFSKFNRPIRVCGMVKNVGEPGGGPFWVMDEKENISLQIVESAQVDMNNQKQKNILNSATHFNPVDIVCGLRNYKGEKYNLTNFVDYKAAFVSSKTQSGIDIKALELPGLWNGSMAYWNTIFVEVPLNTFNPVKTVNDLLRDSHQVH